MDATEAHVEVLNEAFLDLGEQAIETFEDELEGVENMERRYRTIVGAILTNPAFGVSSRRVRLNRLSTAPESGYAYQFTSPAGGDISAVYASADTQIPYLAFRIIDGKVQTDLTDAWAEILSGQLAHPETWPDYLRQAVVACLKAEFAFNITGDRLLARDLRLTAYGPPGEDPDGGLVKSARQRASQQQGGGQLQFGPDPITSARVRGRRRW